MSRALCVIGGGNMAQAIIAGAVEEGSLESRAVVVVEPDAAKRELFKEWGISSRESGVGDGQILLAVKPQVFDEVAESLSGLVDGRVVMSIMAGVSSERIRASLGDVRVVRLMPNMPVREGVGTTALALGAGSRAGDDKLARAIFESVGAVETIDESMMDAYTAIAGSGPAYLFYLAEAMSRAGVDMGFPKDVAERIVAATLAGSALVLAETDTPAAELRAQVTSKGGTTAAAINVMDEAGMMDTINRAVLAARDRGRELA